MGRRVLAAPLVAVLGLLLAAPASAQLAVPVTFAGEVVWISGQRMMVNVRDRAVPVDLSEIPLDAYLAVQPGAAVLVRGVYTEGGVLVASLLETLPGVPGPAERELR